MPQPSATLRIFSSLCPRCSMSIRISTRPTSIVLSPQWSSTPELAPLLLWSLP
ncbi:hypothetical protein SVAN01_11381 [Stagonosporopsis vannaccii]|nr:hypothetical protein SVAN01_11381 [Stagonosporopsis vannaccii]